MSPRFIELFVELAGKKHKSRYMDHREFFDVRSRAVRINLLLESADMKFNKRAEPSLQTNITNQQTSPLCLVVNIKL